MKVATSPASGATLDETSSTGAAAWLGRLDRWCAGISDSLNPILIKETRQALKSRQFVITFSALLIAALGWTVIGSLSMMPQIYTEPSAQRMLTGYYIVLAIPMLLIVPLAAFRSLEGEIDDGTLELLSITILSPRQIVLGKLASAMLQMLLYFIALLPCVAYAYTLRGVDLPTTMLMVGMLGVAGVLMTIVALVLAPLSRSRTGRIATLLALLLLLLLVEYFVGLLVIAMIQFGNPVPPDWTIYLVAFVLMNAVSLGILMLAAAAAQLTPESENRSTPLRIGMLIQSSVMIGLTAFALAAFRDERQIGGVFLVTLLALAGLWTLAGSMFAAEPATMTPRIRRELPNSFFARMLFTFLSPGPATGLVFTSLVVIVIASAGYLGLQYLRGLKGLRTFSPSEMQALVSVIVLYSCYLIGFLIAVRWIVWLVRIRNNPRTEIGVAAMIVVLVITALIPYSIGLHFNDYRGYPYSAWQATNWAWTMVEGIDGDITFVQLQLMMFIVGAALFVSCISLGRDVLPQRTAVPARVLRERHESR